MLDFLFQNKKTKKKVLKVWLWGRKTSDFQTVRILTIFRTSRTDVMFSKALVSAHSREHWVWVNDKHHNVLTRFLNKLFEPIAQPLITLHFVALPFFAHFFYFFYFLSIYYCIAWVQILYEFSFELFPIFW